MRLSDIARKKKFEKRGDGIERATKKERRRMGPPFLLYLKDRTVLERVCSRARDLKEKEKRNPSYKGCVCVITTIAIRVPTTTIQ